MSPLITPTFVITDKASQFSATPIVDAPALHQTDTGTILITKIPPPSDLPPTTIITDKEVPVGEGEPWYSQRQLFGLQNWQIVGGGALAAIGILFIWRGHRG